MVHYAVKQTGFYVREAPGDPGSKRRQNIRIRDNDTDLILLNV